jgi:protein involved in polysaccharide export with SLBB domain
MFMRKGAAVLTATTAFFCASAALATTLHPGDHVSVNVYNHPELAATSAPLDSTGHVSVPVAGLVDAANISPSELATRIAQRLAPYVRKPAVDVQLVSQGQNIFVAGGPGGILPYSPGETLAAALAQIQQGTVVGGAVTPTDPSQIASRSLQYGSVELKHVVINRDGQDLPPVDATALTAGGNGGPALQPDDTIKLEQKPIAVAVHGDVKQPGVAHLDPDEPLSNAVLQVGGTDELTSSVEFVLTRGTTQSVVTTSSAAYRAPAQSGDSIYVPHGERVGVVGQVEKPGSVLLQGDGSLLSALYFAGGPTKYGDIKHVGVIHQGVSQTYDVTKLTHGAPDANPQLADGDTVFVPEGHKIDFSVLFQGIFAASNLRYL